MFQSIVRQTVCKNLSAKCSTTSSTTLRKEINRVKLVGTIFGEQFKNEFGQKLIRVKTNEDGSDKYQIHTLYTNTPQDYEAGQRVFVGGFLSSKDFMSAEEKRRQQFIIRAYQIYALNSMDGDEMKMKDLNSVELLTSVCTDVIQKDDMTFFQVVTNVQNMRTQEIRQNFHSVVVKDKDLGKFVRNNLERGDRIYMRGSLNFTNQTTADGKRRQGGSISAEAIDKVKRFSR